MQTRAPKTSTRPADRAPMVGVHLSHATRARLIELAIAEMRPLGRQAEMLIVEAIAARDGRALERRKAQEAAAEPMTEREMKAAAQKAARAERVSRKEMQEEAT